MELTGSSFGFGSDEPICLEIQDGVHAKVHGRGRAYFLRKRGPSGLKFGPWSRGMNLKYEGRSLGPAPE